MSCQAAAVQMHLRQLAFSTPMASALTAWRMQATMKREVTVSAYAQAVIAQLLAGDDDTTARRGGRIPAETRGVTTGR